MDGYLPPKDQYAVRPEEDPLDDILGLRRKTLRRKMYLLEEQMDQRKKNLEENLYQIEMDLCECNTIAANLPYGDAEGQNRIVLRHNLPLHKETRQQKTDYLRDTAMLRREFLDTFLQYLSLQDKEQIMK